MKTLPLAEFVSRHGQKKAAEFLGVTQGAVSQMMRSARKIEVDIDGDNFLEAREIKIIARAPMKALA